MIRGWLHISVTIFSSYDNETNGDVLLDLHLLDLLLLNALERVQDPGLFVLHQEDLAELPLAQLRNDDQFAEIDALLADVGLLGLHMY